MIRFRDFITEQRDIRILDGNELAKIIHSSRKNDNVFQRLKYLHPTEIHREIHIIELDDDKIIGSVALQENPYDKKQVWFKHVTVDNKYRNKGIARALIERAFEFVSKHPKYSSISISSFSDEGESKLKPLFKKLETKYQNITVRYTS